MVQSVYNKTTPRPCQTYPVGNNSRLWVMSCCVSLTCFGVTLRETAGLMQCFDLVLPI